jgi:cytoskeletal protein CcmA (bactofilin family)
MGSQRRRRLLAAIGAACLAATMASCLYVSAGVRPPSVGTAMVGGPFTVDGPLTVTGPLTVSGPLTVHGMVKARETHVYGPVDTNLPAHEKPGPSGQVSATMTVGGMLTVNGPLTVDGMLSVYGPLEAEGFEQFANP